MYFSFNMKVFKDVIYVNLYGIKSGFYYDHPIYHINQIITLSGIEEIQMHMKKISFMLLSLLLQNTLR